MECAFTSPVIIELGMLVMYCMQFVMSVSVVSMVSCCGVAVFLGAMYMLAMVMFQRLPPARGGTAQRKILHLANWSQLIHPGPASSMTKFFFVSVNHACQRCLIRHPRCYYLDTRNFE